MADRSTAEESRPGWGWNACIVRKNVPTQREAFNVCFHPGEIFSGGNAGAPCLLAVLQDRSGVVKALIMMEELLPWCQLSLGQPKWWLQSSLSASPPLSGWNFTLLWARRLCVIGEVTTYQIGVKCCRPVLLPSMGCSTLAAPVGGVTVRSSSRFTSHKRQAKVAGQSWFPGERAPIASLAAAPSLAVLKARLDGALSTLGWCKMSLVMAGGLEPDELWGPFPTQTILWFYHLQDVPRVDPTCSAWSRSHQESGFGHSRHKPREALLDEGQRWGEAKPSGLHAGQASLPFCSAFSVLI